MAFFSEVFFTLLRHVQQTLGFFTFCGNVISRSLTSVEDLATETKQRRDNPSQTTSVSAKKIERKA